MKISKEKIYTGNIRKCTKYNFNEVLISREVNNIFYEVCEYVDKLDEEDELYKENATLIKVSNDVYIELEKLILFLDIIKNHKDIDKDIFGDLLMSTSVLGLGCLFVDKDTLKHNNKNFKNLTLKL